MGLISEKPPKGNRVIVIGAGLSAVNATEKLWKQAQRSTWFIEEPLPKLLQGSTQ